MNLSNHLEINILFIEIEKSNILENIFEFQLPIQICIFKSSYNLFFKSYMQ